MTGGITMRDMKDKLEDVKDNVEEKADNAKIKLDFPEPLAPNIPENFKTLRFPISTI